MDSLARGRESMLKLYDEIGSEIAADAVHKTPSAVPSEYEDSPPVPASTYRSLARKYNILYTNYSKVKDARAELEQLLRHEQAKLIEYHENDLKMASVIQRLKEEVRFLKGDSREGSRGGSVESTRKPCIISRSDKEIHGSTVGMSLGHCTSSKKDIEMLQQDEITKPKGSVQPHSGHAIQTGIMHWKANKKSRILPPANNSSLADKGDVLIPGSDPVEALSDGITHPVSGSNEDEMLLAPTDNNRNNGFLDSTHLSALRNMNRNGDGSVDDTQFVDIEVHRSSSTQEDPDFKSLARVAPSKSPPRPHLTSSPDIPVVVSARVVKKRTSRGNLPSPRHCATKVKVEGIITSSPLGLHAFLENDSIDLDDIGDKQMTPMKQQPSILHRAPGHLLVSANAARISTSNCHDVGKNRQFSGNFTTTIHTPNPRDVPNSTGSALRPVSTNKQILPRATEDRAPKRRRIASNDAVADLMEDGENLQFTNNNGKTPSGKAIGRLSNLLDKPTPPKRTLSPVVRVLKQKQTSLPDVKVQNRSSVKSLRTSVAKIANQPSPKKHSRSTIENIRTAFTAGSNLKYGTIETRSSTIPPKSGPATPKGLNHPSSDKQRKPGPTRMTVAQRRSFQTAGILNAAVDHPSNEPLCSRPVNKLSLTDFKINPNYNQGKDFAFTEVVRDKEARRCLQGCTKTECCGNKFRKLATMLREPDEVLTMSQEEADQALLEEFLGGNAHTLRNMDKEEKEELLLQARTRDLANKHGRHRYAYERPKSPVGYWRVDFPTTQEAIEDRQKIRERERRKVEQRYREAMRPGGAYIFKDE